MKYLILAYKYSDRRFRRIFDKLYPHFYKHMPGLHLGENVKFWGKPLIDIRGDGKIIIGKNTQIISSNIGTHVNYGAPAKFLVDRPGAEIILGENCRIGGACFHAYRSIKIGDKCLIGTNTNIIDAHGHPVSLERYGDRVKNIDDSKPVVIEKNCWIAINCVVLPGTHVGEGTIVSANSVVSGEIPAHCIVAGNPAIVIKKLK